MSVRTDVIPIDEAVKEYTAKGGTLADICKSLNWYYGASNKPDVPKLRRCLGRKNVSGPYNGNGEKYRYKNKTISQQTAGEIVRAMGLNPTEFGL